jgi:hypothetical protein
VSTLLNGNAGVVVFTQTRDVEPGVVVDDAFGGVAPERRPAIEAIEPLAAQPFGVSRDAFWPRSVIAWLVLSVVLITLSVQLVSPTRRWRLGLRRGSRRNV